MRGDRSVIAQQMSEGPVLAPAPIPAINVWPRDDKRPGQALS